MKLMVVRGAGRHACKTFKFKLYDSMRMKILIKKIHKYSLKGLFLHQMGVKGFFNLPGPLFSKYFLVPLICLYPCLLNTPLLTTQVCWADLSGPSEHPQGVPWWPCLGSSHTPDWPSWPVSVPITLAGGLDHTLPITQPTVSLAEGQRWARSPTLDTCLKSSNF